MMRILHLSDLHFGIEAGKEMTEEAAAARSHFLEGLLTGLADITRKKPLDYIFVTGDIAYTASRADYAQAEIWLHRLADVCNVPVGRIYLCPGNHDMDREAGNFSEYDYFCRRMRFPSYTLGGERNHLAGVAVGRDINVICLNTVWFMEGCCCKKGILTGAALLDLIKSEKIYTNGFPVIVLMHHPFSLWNSVKSSGVNMMDTYCNMCSVSDMVLTGHTHEKADGYGYRNGAYVCGNGASVQDGLYYHNFHIYETENTGASGTNCIRTVYAFCGNGWRKRSGRIRLEMKHRGTDGKCGGLLHSFSILWWMRLER